MTIRTLSTKRTKKITEPLPAVYVIFENEKNKLNFNVFFLLIRKSHQQKMRIQVDKIYHRQNLRDVQIQIVYQVSDLHIH